MNCPKCGNELKPSMKFCAKCGTPVQQAAPQQPVQQKPVAPVVTAQPKPVAPEQTKETAQYQPIPMAPVPQQAPAKQQKPQKQKKGKKNLALKITAIVLAIVVLLTGGLFITDTILFKLESDKGDFVTDFPILKQKTQLLVYDAEKFPYENYNIKVDRFTTGKVFKSSTFSGFENVVDKQSDNPIFDIDFKKDGKYQITLEGIVAERTQTTTATAESPTAPSETMPTTPANTESTTVATNAEDPKTVVIIVIVDNDDKDAVDKVTINSKKDDKPIEEFDDVDTGSDDKLVFVKNNTLSAGHDHTVGLKEDGTVISTYDTGEYNSGQCDVDDWSDIVAVSASSLHTVGLRSDGTVVAVGTENFDICNVSDWTDIVEISANSYSTIGLKSDGTVVANNYDHFGQNRVEGWTDIVAVSAGYDYTLGLKKDGTVVATDFVSNQFDVSQYYSGQCEVDDWTDIVAISAGEDTAVGLRSDGTVVIAGYREGGRSDAENWTDIVAISAGHGHIVGLKKDGTVVAAGWNEFGQCDVENWKDIVAVSADYGHTVGLKEDGTVVATGYNQYGQCDIDGWTDIAMPGTKFADPSTHSSQPQNDANSAIENVKVGDYITFGKYEQDNNTANGAEDIEWLVLDVQDGKAFVVSKYALDAQAFNNDFKGITWENSTIRNWLNGTFFNTAFSSGEKNVIATTTVKAYKNSEYVTDPGNDTQDKIFLLSEEEALGYFSSESSRVCKPTEYAKKQGVLCYGDIYVNPDPVADGNCYWWLRSPGQYNQTFVLAPDSNGYIHAGEMRLDPGNIDNATYGVRPAMWINVN